MYIPVIRGGSRDLVRMSKLPRLVPALRKLLRNTIPIRMGDAYIFWPDDGGALQILGATTIRRGRDAWRWENEGRGPDVSSPRRVLGFLRDIVGELVRVWVVEGMGAK